MTSIQKNNRSGKDTQSSEKKIMVLTEVSQTIRGRRKKLST